MADPTRFHVNGRMLLQGKMPLPGLKINLQQNPDGTVTASAYGGKASATAPSSERAIADCRAQLRELAVAGPGKKPGEFMPEGKQFHG